MAVQTNDEIKGTEKEFLDLFNHLCYSRTAWQVWSDLMSAMACTIANVFETNPKRKADREKEYERCIKELGGEPVTSGDGMVTKGQDVRGIFPFDADLEDTTIDAYNQFLQVCRDCGDNISTTLFQTIIDEEQIHFNHFDNVAGHIKTLGDAYLSRIAGTPASTGGTTKGFALPGAGA